MLRHRFCGMLMLLLPATAAGQVFECFEYSEFSTAWMAHEVGEPVSLMVTPAAAGDPFGAARTVTGEVDATIHLELRDCADVPIATFPYEDIWLESADGGLVACIGGTAADANTGPDGRTSWTEPLAAGGHSEAGLVIMILGVPGTSGPPLALNVNSPDINGSRVVDLTDLTFFVSDYFGAYNYRSDLHFDGRVDLLDVVRFAGAMGTGCP